MSAVGAALHLAAAAASSASSSSSSHALPSFSPLTLFESTLMNAGMLLESMSMDELLSAMRMTANLHLQLVGAVQPCATELQRKLIAATVDNHRQLYARPSLNSSERTPESLSPAATRVKTKTPIIGGISSRRSRRTGKVPPSLIKEEIDPMSHECASPPPMSPKPKPSRSHPDSPSIFIAEAYENHPRNQQPPTVDLMEEDAGGASAETARGYLSSAGSLLLGNITEMCEDGLTAAVEGSAGSADRLAICGTGQIRGVLKESYKQLRGSGPHLFDFSKSWTDLVNQTVARSVISHAQLGSGLSDTDNDVWRSACSLEFRSMQSFCLRNRPVWRKGKRQKAKLGRRQKAFEAILSALTPDELDRYRVVLTRDVTSSDEEDEDETLRIRELSWQSELVRAMKRRLDEVFTLRFATVKQRVQLARCLRDPDLISGRAPPVGIPDWAVRTGE